ncbi:MAG: hypothetical protein QOI95_3667 [Acidimicrobiaceae bacterium]|jgi:tetratricopeptide (TPR) repeat protein
MAGTTFVGRGDELAALENWLDEASQGKPRVVLLAGEAGVGKTQLLNRFVDESEKQQPAVTVLRGTGHEGVGVPYLPLADALRPAGDLSALLAPLRGDDTPEHADERRLRLFLGAAELLRAATEAGPVLLIVDDLHWADRGSLDLLGHLLHGIGQADGSSGGRVLVVLAHRPVVVTHAASAVLDRVRREPWHRVLDVSGFSRFALHDLVEAITGHRASRDLLNGLEEASAGNPLLARALLARLESFGMLSVRNGRLVHRGGEEILAGPREIDALLRDRVNAVSPRARSLLMLAAFLGEGAPLDDLCAVSGLELERFLALVDEAVSAGVLLQDDRVAFDHPQLRQVLHQQPRGKRRQELHLRIADHHEPLLERRPELLIPLAHHLRRAGEMVTPDRLLRVSVKAAHEAAGIVAYAEAVRCYEAAIAASEALGEQAGAFVALLHGRAAYACWYDHDNEAATRHARAAIELARELRDYDLWAFALDTLARAMWSGDASTYGSPFDLGPFDELIAEVGEGDPALRGRLLRLRGWLRFQSLDVVNARTDIERALELIDESDPQTVGLAEYGMAGMHLAEVDLEDALARFDRSIECLTAAGDRLQSLAALRGIAMTQFALGNLAEAADAADEAIATAPSIAAWAEHSSISSVAASIAAARGRFDEAEAHASTAEELMRWAGYPPVAAVLYSSLAYVRHARGDIEGALAAIETWASIDHRGVGRFRLLLAVLSGQPGDVEPTRRPPITAPVLFDVAALSVAVEVGDALDDVDRIAWAAPGITHLAERGLRFGLGWPFFVPGLAAVAARRLGQVEAAERWSAVPRISS